MLGYELEPGVIFKWGEGPIKRWLRVATVGPVSHLRKGNIRRLTAVDATGKTHRVKLDADADYPTAAEFPKRKPKRVEPQPVEENKDQEEQEVAAD